MGGRGSIGSGYAASGLSINGNNIMESIKPYIGKYKYIGIRTQEEPFELGNISHKSSVWRDGDETGKLLSGISATSYRSEAVAAHSDIKKTASLRNYKNSGYYFGDNVAVIVGNSATRGRDVGEIIIRDPKVVKILKRGD